MTRASRDCVKTESPLQNVVMLTNGVEAVGMRGNGWRTREKAATSPEPDRASGPEERVDCGGDRTELYGY